MAFRIPIGDRLAVNLAVNLLKSGQVIAVPTDTVYGLACDATNPTAIERLYQIKQRNPLKPLAICLSGVSEVGNWAKIEHLPNGLLESLLPGPVTLILSSKSKLNQSLISEDKIGIRVPDYPFIRNLIKSLKFPIALTSANLSNHPSSVQIDDFQDLFKQLSGVFDGGILNSNRIGSTIVDLSQPGEFGIIRAGIANDKTIETLTKFGLR